MAVNQPATLRLFAPSERPSDWHSPKPFILRNLLRTSGLAVAESLAAAAQQAASTGNSAGLFTPRFKASRVAAESNYVRPELTWMQEHKSVVLQAPGVANESTFCGCVVSREISLQRPDFKGVAAEAGTIGVADGSCQNTSQSGTPCRRKF